LNSNWFEIYKIELKNKKGFSNFLRRIRPKPARASRPPPPMCWAQPSRPPPPVLIMEKSCIGANNGSVLNLAIFPCHSNLLLRRRGWTGILRRGVLGYVLPRLLFLWCYGVFCCSVLLRVIIVFRDTTYVIIILYS
jgi:hypothetical protein